MRISYLTLIVATLFAANAASARKVREWTYNDLLKESELVVIVNAVETKTLPNTEHPWSRRSPTFSAAQAAVVKDVTGKPPDSDDLVLQQVETTFQVRAVVKGTFGKKRLVLVHDRWKTDRSIVRGLLLTDWPELVTFPNNEQFWDETVQKFVKGGADCLLFLRLRKDGKCEPVSGQIDPIDSVRWLTAPGP